MKVTTVRFMQVMTQEKVYGFFSFFCGVDVSVIHAVCEGLFPNFAGPLNTMVSERQQCRRKLLKNRLPQQSAMGVSADFVAGSLEFLQDRDRRLASDLRIDWSEI